MTIPWIAFVPDISGVCSIVGTLEITSKPRKIASTRIVSSRTNGGLYAATSSVGRATQAPAMISSSKSSVSSPPGARCCSSASHVARVELARVGGHQRRQVREADDRDAVADDLLARARSARSCRRSRRRGRRSAARAHLRDRRGGDQLRRRAARDERGGDDDVEVGDALLERRLLLRPAARASAPARSRPRSPRRGRRGRGTSRRATRPAPSPPGGRRSRDDGAEPARRRDRLQARRRRRRARAPWPAGSSRRRSSASGRSFCTRSAAISTAL